MIGLLSAGLCGAQSVVLHLRNGDRLTGRVLSEDTNAVVLATPYSERLSVPAQLIEKRELLPQPQAPKAATNQPPPPVAPASGVVGELVLTNKPGPAIAGHRPTPPSPPPTPPKPSTFQRFLSEWHGEAQLGANLGFSTKDREAFTGLVRFTHNHRFANGRGLRNILGYDVSYATSDHAVTDNRMDGTWKTEYDLGQRFLLYNAARAGYDEVRGINFQYDVGPGLGYKWVILTNFVFKTELGGDYQEQFFVQEQQTSRYSLRLAEDFWWQITPKLRWDERIEFFPDVTDPSEYRIRLETNLSYLLKQNLTLSLNVIDLYDTAVPPGVSKNDLQIRSLVGIRF